MRLPWISRRKAESDLAGLADAFAAKLMGDREPGRDLDGALRIASDPVTAYKSWSYAAIRRIVDTGAACPFVVKSGDKPAGDNNPLVKLLTTANPLQNSVRLMSTTMANLELWGTAYWEIVRSGKQAAELWPIPPESMTVGKVENGLPATWNYTGTNGLVRPLQAEDVVWFRYSSPGSAMSSRAPLSAAELAVQADIHALRYYCAYFERGANVDYALETDSELTDAQITQLQEQFAKRYGGLRRFFKPLVLQAGLKASKLSGEPQLAWMKLREQLREEILAIWGVPPAIVGVYQYANYANVKEQRRIFWQQTIQPKHRAMAADINEQLGAQLGNVGEFEWTYSHVPELRADLAEEANLALRALTVNELRDRYFGLEPVTWGDQPASSGGALPASGA